MEIEWDRDRDLCYSIFADFPSLTDDAMTKGINNTTCDARDIRRD